MDETKVEIKVANPVSKQIDYKINLILEKTHNMALNLISLEKFIFGERLKNDEDIEKTNPCECWTEQTLEKLDMIAHQIEEQYKSFNIISKFHIGD